jgi:hypothetical protein
MGFRRERALEAALAFGVDAIVLFVLDVNEPALAVTAARARVPVVAIHNGCIVFK